MSRNREPSTPERKSTTVPRLKIILPDPRSIQRVMNQIVGTLNDPEYQEQLTKLTQASVKISLQTLQKLSRFSTRVSRLDSKGWDFLINCSIDDLMRTYLQFNSELIGLLSKLSGKTMENLDKCIPSPKELKCPPPKEIPQYRLKVR